MSDRLGGPAHAPPVAGADHGPGAACRLPIDEIEAFLAVARECHFGHAAQSLFISRSRVSRLVASFERRVGGTLFERTSRVVRPTPLARRLHDDLSSGYAAMVDALHAAESETQGRAGTIAVGFSPAAGRALLNGVLDAVEARNPECRPELVEVSVMDPFAPLRAGDIDVLLTWFMDPSPDIAFGPVLAQVPRMLAVCRTDELARRDFITAEELADLPVARTVTPTVATEAVSPSWTPKGRPITGPRTHGLHDALALVGRGQCVHPTVPGLADIAGPDIVLIPIPDLPALPYGPMWMAARANARIRGFASACELDPVANTLR